MTIKLVIFDAYGVTVIGGFPPTMKALAKRFDKNWEELLSIFYTKWFTKAVLKEISQEEAWQYAIDETKLPITVEEIKELHYSFMSINENMRKTIKMVENDGKIAVMLTKNTMEQQDDVDKILHYTNLFKFVLNTWILNLPKASKETIEHVLKKFNVKPEETIYIDDLEENLSAAKAMGVHTIFYENFEQFKREFNKTYK